MKMLLLTLVLALPGQGFAGRITEFEDLIEVDHSINIKELTDANGSKYLVKKLENGRIKLIKKEYNIGIEKGEGSGAGHGGGGG